MHPVRRSGLLFLVCVIITPLSALTWERQSAPDLAMEAGNEALVTEFRFKNERPEPVTIRELKASCGCTAPTVETQLIPAGGKGVIKVTYTPGDRVGGQTAQVTVITDEVGAEPATLQLRINIRPAISLTPRLVLWKKADGLVGRTIEIKRLSKAAVSIVAPKPTSDNVNVEIKPGATADTWLLTLTPKSVETPSTTKVEIPVTVGERRLMYSVFAVVR